MKCLIQAWLHNESDIKAWLICKTHDVEQAEDLMQDTFLKALKHQEKFCTLDNARSWLFKMVRNTLIDHMRTHHPADKLTTEFDIHEQEKAPILGLLSCLPRVLSELDDDDRDVIECCDLYGMTQADYAQLNDISTAGAKSRIQRARQKLKQHLTCACQVKLTGQKVCSYVPRHKS